MDSVRGMWGYKTTGKSCWCFPKYLDLQRATEQFQGIIFGGGHSLIFWTHSENNSLNAGSGPSFKPRSAFPLISVCSGSGPPSSTALGCVQAQVLLTQPQHTQWGACLAPGSGETQISSWLCSAHLDFMHQPSSSLPDLGGICKKKGDVRKRNSLSAEGWLSMAGVGLGAARCSCELPQANVSSLLHQAFTFTASRK